MQTDATHAILGTLDRKGDPAGSVVSIDPKTGQIRAMALAQTGKTIAYDLPVDGHRQAGSTFKMFVLTNAVRAGDQPVLDAVPLGAVRRARQLARPHVREHVLGPDPADAGHAPLRQHGLRASHARPRPQADRRARTPDGDPVEAQARPVDRARRERGEPARPRDRVRHARGRRCRSTIRPSCRRSSFPDGHSEQRLQVEGEAGRRSPRSPASSRRCSGRTSSRGRGRRRRSPDGPRPGRPARRTASRTRGSPASCRS